MNRHTWRLPDGIDEVLPPDAWALEQLRRRVLDLFVAWGYQYVEPPLVEFLDSLLVGSGNDLELQTFRMVDQRSGRMLGIRADMTSQAARIDAASLRRRRHPTALLCRHRRACEPDRCARVARAADGRRGALRRERRRGGCRSRRLDGRCAALRRHRRTGHRTRPRRASFEAWRLQRDFDRTREQALFGALQRKAQTRSRRTARRLARRARSRPRF